MASTFNITASDLKSAQYAIDTLTGSVAIEDDVAAGIAVLRGLVAQGAIGADLVAITGKSKSNVGRVTGLITLSGMLDSDLPGDGIMRANKAVNAAGKVKGLNFTKKHVNVWAKDGRRFTSWNAVADAVEKVLREAQAVPTVGTEDDEQQQSSGKTYDEKIEDLLKKARKIAKDHDSTPADVLADVWALLERTPAEAADEAADAAELAS